MKQNRIRKILSAMLCVVLVFVLGVVPVFANSAPSRWSGVDSTGAIIVGEASPILVEREILTFDIQEFPENYYDDLQEYLAYSGKVTAEYTFYNPSDYTVTATLMFPFGCEPNYAYNYDYDTETFCNNVDTEKFGISVDGEPIEKTLRYTLSSGFDQFELDRDLALLHDGYVEDPFYFPDTPVYKYTFKASDIDTDTYEAANVGFDIDQKDEKRKIYFVEESGFHEQDGGKMRLSNWVENGDTMTVYVIGEDYEVFPELKFYEDGGVEDKEEIDGTVTPIGKETLTFKEFALSEWTKDSGVSETDWYNAVVAMLDEESNYQGSVLYTGEYALDLSTYLMRWYEYEITLEPGQRIVNTVTAPIYPSINLDYDPGLYGYSYLLSPAKLWKSFGELEIVVNTPYYMSNCSIDGFTKTETGYTAKLDGLPKGELTFDLSTSKEPTRTYTPYEIAFVVIVASFIIGVVMIVGVIVAVCILIVRWRKR